MSRPGRFIHLLPVLVAAVLTAACDRAREDEAAERAAQAVRQANKALNQAEAVAREGAKDAAQLARKAGEAAKDGAREVGRLMSEGGLTAKVKAALLADDAIPGSRIDVDSDGGVVTLSGKLASQDLIERALTIARNVQGVERVENRLTVEGQG